MARFVLDHVADHLFGLGEIGRIRDAKGSFRAAGGVDRVVDDHIAPDLRIGHDDLQVVDGGKLDEVQIDGFHRAGDGIDLDEIPHLEGAEHDDHPPRRDIRQRSLQRQTGGTDHGDDRGRLDPEGVQDEEDREGSEPRSARYCPES